MLKRDDVTTRYKELVEYASAAMCAAIGATIGPDKEERPLPKEEVEELRARMEAFISSMGPSESEG